MRMLGGARVIAIDDNKADLDGIVAALRRHGVGVLPFHYKGERSVQKCASGIRVVFADINIVPSAANPYQQHQAVAAVLDKILHATNGPWILVAWTASPHQVPQLKQVLDSLGRDRAPTAALGLDKSQFTRPNRTFDIRAVAKAITSTIAQDPVADALLDLEIRASDAAHDVIRSIVSVAKSNSASDLGQVLASMASAAGPGTPLQPEHVFETLGPVFQDRLIRREVTAKERKLWTSALQAGNTAPLTDEQRADLNTALHLDPRASAGDRGALTLIPPARTARLEKAVGQSLEELVFLHFLKRDKAISVMLNDWKRSQTPAPPGSAPAARPSDAALESKFLAKVGWGILEIVPACDVANNKRGIRRAAIVMTLPAEMNQQKPAGDYVQSIPIMKLSGAITQVFVSAKTIISPVPRSLDAIGPAARIRDQLLDAVTQHIAGSQARLGWTSF